MSKDWLDEAKTAHTGRGVFDVLKVGYAIIGWVTLDLKAPPFVAWKGLYTFAAGYVIFPAGVVRSVDLEG